MVGAVALLYVVMWSTTFIAVKIGVRYCPPLTLLTLRFLFAATLLVALVRWLGERWPVDRRAWARLALFGMLNQAIPASMTFVGMRHASAGMGSMILVTNPLIVALLAPKLLGEALTRTKLLGLLLALGGVGTVLVARLHTGHSHRTDSPLGIALLFGAVACLVSATILFKRFPPREPLIMVNVVQQLIAGLFLVPVALSVERPTTLVPTLSLGLALLYLVFVISIGSSLLWFWILKKGEASTAGAYLFLAPIFGLIFASLVLGETFRLRDGIGLLIVSVGVTLIRWSPRARQQRS
jgi:drug/metabolite transporter (DMT)-like permease